MEKKWFQSTSIQGSVVSALGLLVQVFKLPVASDEISSGVSAVMLLVGIGVSIWGRIKTNGEKLTK